MDPVRRCVRQPARHVRPAVHHAVPDRSRLHRAAGGLGVGGLRPRRDRRPGRRRPAGGPAGTSQHDRRLDVRRVAADALARLGLRSVGHHRRRHPVGVRRRALPAGFERPDRRSDPVRAPGRRLQHVPVDAEPGVRGGPRPRRRAGVPVLRPVVHRRRHHRRLVRCDRTGGAAARHPDHEARRASISRAPAGSWRATPDSCSSSARCS